MESFPIDEILTRLKEAVSANPSVVLHAPPGAGKTTRVPLALLDIFPSEKGRVIMLEPRRIAATSAARWMAKGLGEQVGETIGYSIRFDSRVSKKTRVEVVTEGILTRRIQADPGLEGVSMVIFDEFHERSLHADLALALCLDLRRGLREDLKVLVMSATLECGPVASLLGGAPVISSEGRGFPVEERYLMEKTRPLPKRIAGAVDTAMREASGDVLVFLPGAAEIRACNQAIDRMPSIRGMGITVHPLYGDLPFEEQEQAILPSGKRKIILATNIAETSLTIEGVGVVIDSGLTRRLQYDPSTGMNRLITISVSKASAEQRKGRAGRLSPGVCYRLYSRNAFHAMVPFAQPEMLASELSSLALELAVWGVKQPSALSWLDPPPASAWEQAVQLLLDLGALDKSVSVTSEGRTMARIPLHPRLARLLLRAEELGCPRLGADIAALLSERDILRRSMSTGRMVRDSEPDIAVRTDFLEEWRKGSVALDNLDPWALKAVDRISGQLIGLMHRRPKGAVQGIAGPDAISRLLLSAFPDRVAQLRQEGDGHFVLSQGRGVRLPSTTGLSKSPYIVAVNVDAGEKAEGIVYLAAPLSAELIRRDCSGRIGTLRRVEWDRHGEKIIATVEERVGAVVLSSRPFSPSDEEALPILCEAVSSTPGMLIFSSEARQFQGRVAFMRRTFPDEDWPDLSDERLLSSLTEWLLAWLRGRRSSQDIKKMDILPALKARLPWEQTRLLEDRAPTTIVVPSGHRVQIDYAAGDVPVLAVKLQEMFGLADTPAIAGGRVKVLLHLLSPARRPVQITKDLKGFWNSGYQQVKRELKGRYPKHPWPDDPWNAVPTRRTKRRV
jgi:ATP-dependent helicase HrpB